MSKRYEELLNNMENLIEGYLDLQRREEKFVPGETRIQFAGPVFDNHEIFQSLKSLLTGWFVNGEYTRQFEHSFANMMGIKHCVTVNSGSSALLIAWYALKNKALEDPLKDGDEVITCGLTHPATVNSLLLNKLRPVLVDAEIPEYNIDPDSVEEAMSDKTRGILPMHFLGNPCRMDKIMEIAKTYNLCVVEDACDAYGGKFNGRKIGTFGNIGTVSFYTAHGITLGEGGALIYDSELYDPLIRSIRAWGRSCPCDVCKITINPHYKCPLRFKRRHDHFGDYDMRYLFSNIGYNLKIIDAQAAFGLGQLKKFPYFIKKRNENFKFIVRALDEYSEYLILPKSTPDSEPVWFTVPITIREGAPFSRTELVRWLENHCIETRPFFAGYLPEQLAYSDSDIRIVGELVNTKFTKNNSFFIGCYPGISKEMRQYIIEVFHSFFKKRV